MADEHSDCMVGYGHGKDPAGMEECKKRCCDVCGTYMRDENRCQKSRYVDGNEWPCGALLCSMRCMFEHNRVRHPPTLRQS